MTAYASGRTTALILNSGHSQTTAVSVFEGYAIPHAIEKMEIGGNLQTSYMQRLLVDYAAESFSSTAELEIVKKMKESVCYVAYDF